MERCIIVPNDKNINSPINIHGFGRSGTTLLQNIIGANYSVQTCNETAGLVFCTFRGGEVALLSDDTEVVLAPAELPPLLVRSAMCSAMPSTKERWTQKLGGLPNYVVWEDLVTTEDRHYASSPYPFPYSWYWGVLRRSFPESVDILIIRDWRDVVISRARFSGWNPRDIAEAYSVYLNLMAHPLSMVRYTINFEDLVFQPGILIPNLLQSIEVPSSSTVFTVMDTYHSGSGERSLTTARGSEFTWIDEYAQLDRDLEQIILPSLARIGQRFETTATAVV